MAEILAVIGNAMTILVTTALSLGLLARLLPNEKLYDWGYKFGIWINTVGYGRMGKSWNNVETFIQNSFGKFFTGVRDGLDADEQPAPENPEQPL